MEIKSRCSIDIVDMGTGGEGIGHAEGMAVFIPGAVTGDRAMVEITQMKKNFARGKLLKIEEPSPKRVEPACPAAGRCGGCPLAALSYEGQLALKQKWVADRLARIGGFVDLPVEPIIGMKDGDTRLDLETGRPIAANDADLTGEFMPARYRNKAHFPVWAGRLRKNNEGKYRNDAPCRVGTYRAGSHEVIQCETCLIHTEPAEAIAAAVKQYVDETGVSVYDEKSGMGLLRDVVVRSAFATGEVMAVLVVNGDHLPKIERLAELMDDAVYNCNFPAKGSADSLAGGREEPFDTEPSNAGPFETESFGAEPFEAEPFWSLESIVLNINQEKHGELFGKNCITVAGKPVITDYLGDLQLEISPRSFYQVNPVQMKRLYDKAVEFAELSGRETVLDLYCGVGTIGLYCADRAKRVIGVESVKPAVLDANRNAILNGIVNVEFICGKAEEILPKRLSGIKADVVILDPPRSGCEKTLLDAVLAVAPQRIVYVSCDPATLARDLKILCGTGQGQGVSADVDAGQGTYGRTGVAGQTQEQGKDRAQEKDAYKSVGEEEVGAGGAERNCVDIVCNMGEAGRAEPLSERSPASGDAHGQTGVGQVQYCIEKVQPVDMFPGAAHVESIVLLSKLHTK